MIIPIPIFLTMWRTRSESKPEPEQHYDNTFRVLEEKRKWEQQCWNNMDYSRTYFIALGDKVRECYVKKDRPLQPKEVCCFVDEGHLSSVFTRNLRETKEEAEKDLQQRNDPNNPDLVLESWRGHYILRDKKSGKIVEELKD